MTAAMNEATRQKVRAMMERGEIPYLNDFTRPFYEEGRQEGRREGIALERQRTLRRLRTVLTSLVEARGWTLDARTRARIEACDDPDRLTRWIVRVGQAANLDTALLDDA